MKQAPLVRGSDGPHHKSMNLKITTGIFCPIQKNYSYYFCDVVIVRCCMDAVRFLFKDLGQISEGERERK